TVNATGVVTMGGVQVTRATDGNAGPGGSGPATKNFVDASVAIAPNGVNEVGTSHTFNVTVTAMPGNATPVSFGTISPSVIGSPDSESDTCGSPTINGSVATCSITINKLTPGVITANVSAQVTMGGVTVTRSTSGNPGPGGSGPATKRYVDGSISIQPSADNEVGHQHVLTVTATSVPSGTTITSVLITPNLSPTRDVSN